MTLEDANKIGKVVSRADGGCSHCVEELVGYLNRDFPEFTWEISGYTGSYPNVKVTENA